MDWREESEHDAKDGRNAGGLKHPPLLDVGYNAACWILIWGMRMRIGFGVGRKLIVCAAVIVGIGGGLFAQNIGDAAASIDGARILAHIKVLSSDEFEGRGLGTKGEELSIA
jgi:hypothetical protein